MFEYVFEDTLQLQIDMGSLAANGGVTPQLIPETWKRDKRTQTHTHTPVIYIEIDFII